MKFIDGIVSKEKMVEYVYARCNYCNKMNVLYAMIVNEFTDLAYCNRAHEALDTEFHPLMR